MPERARLQAGSGDSSARPVFYLLNPSREQDKQLKATQSKTMPQMRCLLFQGVCVCVCVADLPRPLIISCLDGFSKFFLGLMTPYSLSLPVFSFSCLKTPLLGLER